MDEKDNEKTEQPTIHFQFLDSPYKRTNAAHEGVAPYWSQTLGDYAWVGQVPELFFFGRTIGDGDKSICVHIHGFLPFFYAEIPAEMRNHEDQALKQLEYLIVNHLPAHRKPPRGVRTVYSIEKVRRTNHRGFNQPDIFWKVTLRMPDYVRTARNLFHNGLMGTRAEEDPTNETQLRTFESDVLFPLRHIVEQRARTCTPCTVSKYTRRISALMNHSCDIEIDCDYRDIQYHEPTDTDVAPAFRMLSFDIECAPLEKHFPRADKDPVIQIASVMKNYGTPDGTYYNKVVHCLRETSAVREEGTKTICYDDEKQFLLGWAEYVREQDPDIMTGYNINNFDFPYLINRARKLGIAKEFVLGRRKGEPATVREKTFTSKAYGARKNWEATITGRVLMDVFQVIVRMVNIKLRSYTLNNVSWNILNDHKLDMHYSLITPFWNGGPDMRRAVAEYCLKDAILPLKLIDALKMDVNNMAMSRVTWVPLDMIFRRGQTIKVKTTMMIKHANGPNGDGENPYIIPFLLKENDKEELAAEIAEMENKLDKDESLEVSGNKQSSQKGARGNESSILTRDVTYAGATVLAPKRGYYSQEEPLATLDFNSLYPSIMMAHNLCYSTMLTAQQAASMSEEDYTRTPQGHLFVNPHIRVGVLPSIETELLAHRKIAKRKMAEAKARGDTLGYAVQDGVQLALKVTANSVYGFTGATIGPCPCTPISESVTGFGREMIEITKKTVEDHFRANGYQDCEVVYGDTDSVMIKFSNKMSIAESIRLAKEAQVLVNANFKKPINIEFEKVMCPCLLLNKKRYASLFWLRPDTWDHIDMKGVEATRRNNAKMVAETMSTVAQIIFEPPMKDEEEMKKRLSKKSTEERKLYDCTNPDGALAFLCDGKEIGDEARWQLAIAFVHKVVHRLCIGQIPLEKLIISAGFTKPVDQYCNKQPHIELIKRMRARDPDSAPKLGDRVPFIMVQRGVKAKPCDCSEDPLYAEEHKLPINVDYYLHKQLKNPLCRLFAPYFIYSKRYKVSGDDETSRFFHAGEVARKELFGADVTRIVKRKIATLPKAFAAFSVVPNCLSCDRRLDGKEHTAENRRKRLCVNCIVRPKRRIRVAKRVVSELKGKLSERRAVWDVCYKCQLRDKESAKRCRSSDCPNFFPRRAVDKAYKEAADLVKIVKDW